MSGDLQKRVKTLEERAERADQRFIVWWAYRGDPEPEHEEGDIVLKVVREGGDEPGEPD
jgi:hypothetical protein